MLSVIIPALDEAKVLGKTLSALQRQEGDYELIVVDGGSHDGTRRIAEQLGAKVIKADVPLSEMFGYVTTLRTLSSGRATSSMVFSHYAECPTNISEKVIEESKA